MKQFSTLLFCLCLFSGLQAQNIPSYLPTNGLVGWWPFNGNANDESGNGNHGTVNGATLTADRFGNPSNSFVFNGLNSNIRINNSTSLNPTSISISAWVNISSNSGTNEFQSIVAKWWQDISCNNNSDNYLLTFKNQSNSIYGFSSLNNQLPNAISSPPNSLEFGQWIHIIFVHDKLIGQKIFLNNSLVASKVIAGPICPSTNDLYFGADNYLGNSLWRYLNGSLDDIAIYNRALTQQEITRLYQAGNETSLSYQLSQQKLGDCNDSPVKLSVQTSVKVKTDSAGSIGSNSAMAYGNILNDGGKTITRRGFCWDTSANPTLSNSFSENGSGSGTFSGSLSTLSPSTTYYLRAYAGTATEVWYGNELSFTTSSSTTSATCGTPNIHNPNLSYGSMSDQDGNVYKTIVIGNQEWMAENLKTGHYRNGDAIPRVTEMDYWRGLNSGAWIYPSNNPANECPYGKLYHWYAVVDPRGLCPTGWHIPTAADWNQLEDFLGDTIAGTKMKSASSLWAYENGAGTNESGFSGLPGGFCGYGILGNVGTEGFWWSSTTGYPGFITVRTLVARNLTDASGSPGHGNSVRCLKDSSENGMINGLSCSFVTTSNPIIAGKETSGTFINVNYNSSNGGNYNSKKFKVTGVPGLNATLSSGNFSFNGGLLKIKLNGVPTCEGEAEFFLEVGGQICQITLQITSGVQVESTSLTGISLVHNPEISYGIVADNEGNSYKTVVIGSQEWMAENLKTSIFRNGDSIQNIKMESDWRNVSTSPAWCNYFNEPLYECSYGKLYNWYSVEDSRGLCPVGWHVPTESEWKILQNYLGDNYAGFKTKSASPLWFVPNGDSINISGFSALPNGLRDQYGFFNQESGSSYMWSSSPSGESFAKNIYNYFGGTWISSDVAHKKAGLAVRCLKGEPETCSVDSLDCQNIQNNGYLVEGQLASEVSTVLNYFGGNGGDYHKRIVRSEGVSGLTATLSAGTLQNGNGLLTYIISGRPTSSGIAYFSIYFGNKYCYFTRTISTIGGGVTDIDGNNYGSVIIGNQEWMSENLKVSRYRNGDPIPTNLSDVAWASTTSGACAIYDNDASNNTTYGKLYNWYAVADPRALCPTGWHVPGDLEWYSMENFLDTSINDPNLSSIRGSVIGSRLKAISSLWLSGSSGSNNLSGFSALPGGGRLNNGPFSSIGNLGVWWSGSANSELLSWARLIDSDTYNTRGTWNKSTGMSVRCLKD